MRMSCNGCRVLRKGCGDDCILRPCLQWIASSDSQANATLFLAKFYGRSGLMNLIEAVPQHLRPSAFRSLLYEACGRIVNPVLGSVGLLWSGNWALCQAAVDSVLVGSPIVQTLPSLSDISLSHSMTFPPKAYDIRHVSSNPNSSPTKKVKNRSRFKQSRATSLSPQAEPTGQACLAESWLSHLRNGDSGKDDESMLSVEAVEGFLTNPILEFKIPNDGELGLDLSLGLDRV